MTSTSRLLNSILHPPVPLTYGAYSGYYYAFYGQGGFSTDQSFNPILQRPTELYAFHGEGGFSLDQSFNPIKLAPNQNETYAFYGQGGFSVDQSFNPILLGKQTSSSFQLYDVTYAIQLKYDVRKFNKKLGLIKDASNITILDTSFDTHANRFPIDSFNISASEFVNEINADHIISVGAYQTLYREYMESANKYFFKINTLDDSLFSAVSTNDISNGLFDANQFVSLINQNANNTPYANTLNGFVTLSNINQLLLYAVENDVFDNRNRLNQDTSANPTTTINFTNSTVTDFSNNTVTTTVVDTTANTVTITIQDNSNNIITTIVDDSANQLSTVTTTDAQGNSVTSSGAFTNIISPTFADVSFSTAPGNYGLANGFLAGDLIFIPGGMSTTLEIVIDPMIDASTSNIYDLIVNSGLAYEYAIDLSNIAVQKTTMINKILTAPLLIELANLS
jgi:hypothetical protein